MSLVPCDMTGQVFNRYLWITSCVRKELFSIDSEFSTFFDSIKERFWLYLDGTYQYSKLSLLELW